ncbi:Ribosome biogenesis protein WDR12 homolog (Fragment), partial [Geodia barretti]
VYSRLCVLQEAVIEIEVIERNPPPRLADVFDHKDWVSGVHINTHYILTGSYDSTVRIWTHDGQMKCSAEGHTSPVKDVVWISSDASSSDSGRVLFASASQDQNVHIWSLAESTAEPQVEHLHTCKGHARSVESLAVNPSHDKLCSVSWDKMLKIWSAVPDDVMVDEVESEDQIALKRAKINSNQRRATTRTPLLTLQGHTQPVSTVVWPTGDEVLSAGMDHCIRIWDIVSGVNKSTLNGPKVFHCIHHSHLNSLVASANSDKLVRLWDTRAGESSMVQSALASHQGWVIAVQWAPNREHQLLSGSYDSSLKVWDIRSSKLPLFTITAHEGKVLCLDWTFPQLLASGGTDSKLRTFNFV